MVSDDVLGFLNMIRLVQKRWRRVIFDVMADDAWILDVNQALASAWLMADDAWILDVNQALASAWLFVRRLCWEQALALVLGGWMTL